MSSARRTGDPATRDRICEAALRLILTRRGGHVSLGEVAREAGVSRQALYLHFADRADLFLAVVHYADDRRGLPAALAQVEAAASGAEALRATATLQARMNPAIWPLAQVLDAVRRTDAAAERSWHDRLMRRLDGCRAIVRRLRKDGTLRARLNEGVATDLLWTLTSLRMWEDLVIVRQWSADEYGRRVNDLLRRVLLDDRRRSASGRRTRVSPRPVNRAPRHRD